MTYKKLKKIFEFLTLEFKKKLKIVIKFFVRNSEK